MKIIYCLARTFNSGGMERIVISKANWLARAGHEVVIVTTEQNGKNDFFPLDSRIRRIDLDILYSENDNAGIVHKFISRRRKLRRHANEMKRLLFAEKPDITISTFGNEVGFLTEIGDGSKKIAEIHFSRWYRLQLNRRGMWRLIDKYLTATDYKSLKRFDAFVCLTKEDSYNWGCVANLHVIPNFVERLSAEQASLDAMRIIAVGRLSYQKGYDRLLEAWKIVRNSFPDWKLEIFGGGELKADLMSLIDGAGLSGNVVLHEPISDISKEYLRSAALVLSSRYEGLPMVLLEGMSCGLPVVSFACQCGPRDIIQDYQNGILVGEGDILGLASALKVVISNPSLRKEMGDAAYKTANDFLMDNVMRKWETLFAKLVNC